MIYILDNSFTYSETILKIYVYNEKQNSDDMKNYIMKLTPIVVNCFFQAYSRQVPFRDPIILL